MYLLGRTVRFNPRKIRKRKQLESISTVYGGLQCSQVEPVRYVESGPSKSHLETAWPQQADSFEWSPLQCLYKEPILFCMHQEKMRIKKIGLYFFSYYPQP